MVLTSEILLYKKDCCFKAKYSSVSNALILPLCHPASHLWSSGNLDHLSRFPEVYFFFHPQNASFIIALFWGRNCVSQIIQDGLHCFKIFEAQLKNKAYSESSRMDLSCHAVSCILPYWYGK